MIHHLCCYDNYGPVSFMLNRYTSGPIPLPAMSLPP
jgi:hypothetical protein